MSDHTDFDPHHRRPERHHRTRVRRRAGTTRSPATAAATVARRPVPRLPQDELHRRTPRGRLVPPNPCSCAVASHRIGARECMRRTALVADTENTTETEETAPETEETADAVAP